MQDQTKGKATEEEPSVAHTFRHVYGFILRAMQGDRPLQAPCTSDISRGNWPRNYSLYRVNACKRTRAGELNRNPLKAVVREPVPCEGLDSACK
jgi:hypothetical protein